MKTISLLAMLLAALLMPGCSWLHNSKSAAPGKTKPAPAVVTPDLSLAAKVVSINTVGRFVVLSFPADRLPKLGQTLFLYRSGLKVAEVKITGPQQENNIVADLVSGEPKVGDTVRAD